MENTNNFYGNVVIKIFNNRAGAGTRRSAQGPPPPKKQKITDYFQTTPRVERPQTTLAKDPDPDPNPRSSSAARDPNHTPPFEPRPMATTTTSASTSSALQIKTKDSLETVTVRAVPWIPPPGWQPTPMRRKMPSNRALIFESPASPPELPVTQQEKIMETVSQKEIMEIVGTVSYEEIVETASQEEFVENVEEDGEVDVDTVTPEKRPPLLDISPNNHLRCPKCQLKRTSVRDFLAHVLQCDPSLMLAQNAKIRSRRAMTEAVGTCEPKHQPESFNPSGGLSRSTHDCVAALQLIPTPSLSPLFHLLKEGRQSWQNFDSPIDVFEVFFINSINIFINLEFKFYEFCMSHHLFLNL